MRLSLVVGVSMGSKAARTVYIIDSDESVRRAMRRLLRLAGLNVRSFASVGEFLGAECSYENACLVADVKVLDADGAELQVNLAESGCRVPVIFVTAYDNGMARDDARRMGAVAYFLKPVDDQALLDAIAWAFDDAAP
jgi:FixJ family two-component response regulator